MSRNSDQEIADMRQELKDLEEAIARQDAPLGPRTRAIAEAKIATLQGQIAAMKRGHEHQPALSDNQGPRVALFLMAETNSVPHCTGQPQNSPTAPLDGWRCDLCGEIVTAQERPLLPPEKCPRCSSVYITSIEAWAARPLLGLWTR